MKLEATPRDRTQATVRFIRAINPNVAKFLYLVDLYTALQHVSREDIEWLFFIKKPQEGEDDD